MAVRLVLGAMTKKGDCLGLREVLQQSEGELLPVVFDGMIATIDRAAFE